jgi:hypothetical protein
MSRGRGMGRRMSMSEPLEPNVPKDGQDRIPAADPGAGAPDAAPGSDIAREDPDAVPGEPDVDRDDAEALTRATGGGPSDEPDAGATTGTGESGTFVGRVAGQDVGYAGETGAERRAAEGEVR